MLILIIKFAELYLLFFFLLNRLYCQKKEMIHMKLIHKNIYIKVGPRRMKKIQ